MDKRPEAFATPGEQRELTAEELMLAAVLISNGWKRKDAEKEAVRAMADAAEEDGYDGP